MSRSPPRRRARYEYDEDPRDTRYRESRQENAYNGRHYRREKQNEEYDRQKTDGGGQPGRDMDRGRPRGEELRQDYGRGGSHRVYEERERERERERDRDRYDKRTRDRDRDRDYERDRAGPSSRRSMSPSRASHPRSTKPAASPSRSASPPVDKTKPNFAPSGLLAAETNTVKAIDGTSTVLKYNEPPEARKPVVGWRLYVFKGSEQVELLHIHRQSAYLIGRDRLVADLAVDHPSCSKQHAVIQYRYVQEKDEFGGSKGVVKPFIIDLESTNGTLVNDEAIPASRYYELRAGDVIKFGQSLREYVLLHDEAV